MNGHQLSILLLKESNYWVAQCLEYDVAAQAATLNDAMYELQRTLVSEMIACAENNCKFPDSIPPAPQYYWELFDRNSVVAQINEKQMYRPPASAHFPLPEKREIRVAS